MTRRVTYAVGDVHGMLDQFARLVDLIAKDAAEYYRERTRAVVYLGDYIDRGENSAGVVGLLMEKPLAQHGFDEICLKGNHEALMEDYYAGKHGHVWLLNGGAQTLTSYGGDVPKAHRDWIAALASHHVRDGFYFAHAGVDPEVDLEHQKTRDLYWIRDRFLNSERAYTYKGAPVKVVHGHSPSNAPELKPNRIGIDTGAYFSGAMTAVVLDGGDPRFLQAHGEPAARYRHASHR